MRKPYQCGNTPIKERKTLFTGTGTIVSTTETVSTTERVAIVSTTGTTTTTTTTLQLQQLIIPITIAISNTGKIIDDSSSSSFLKKDICIFYSDPLPIVVKDNTIVFIINPQVME
ncbi:hypothetical protein ACTA71_009727 [Dictyostelium dimigraforme]